MSNDPNPTPDPTPDPDPAQDPAPAAEDPTDWKAEARKWEGLAKKHKSAAERLQELEDKDKTEAQRLTEDRDSHKTRADQAEGELMRLRVGLAKGLTEAQARRLVGSTKEELEADADDLLATFGGKSDDKPAPSRRPTEHLRGGGDPEEDPEVDLRKIADQIPRR
ncbi:hypothetical protein GUY44_11960 [Pimelobacter simplex]|uniref:Phage capsid and scaffold n=1 Tax=Nocardioides simplex TaxID=2045 RepID=A0A0C5XBC9_NOCSI|nr:hypothetical protein [Pimelobacter simplex]AJR18109.1 Phage capsid and scaffold [Pimelobacter simplex]KAB2809255.1 hypothetical protein F9L07_19635 [Pimelobacter simplex]MCG8151197.1 hypothetical protein [Pimelobacter simplex]SFN18768.1 hypothetical protein SAMN05421671_0012 [Pimelobacter simplex]GEB17210.1 hypothetical protein NSI01_55250 [Pimelobacter simplex]